MAGMGLVPARRFMKMGRRVFSSKLPEEPHHAHRIQGTVSEQIIPFGNN